MPVPLQHLCSLMWVLLHEHPVTLAHLPIPLLRCLSSSNKNQVKNRASPEGDRPQCGVER